MELYGYIISILIVLAVVALWFFRRKKAPSVSAPTEKKKEPANDLAGSLRSTRGKFKGKLSGLETIEDALLEGDVGVSTTRALMDRLKGRASSANGHGVVGLLKEEMEALFSGLANGEKFSTATKPLVISFVGVNGAGKTTTVGKLAARFRSQGKQVLIGAVDTFRAAAIDQLKVWAERTGAQFVTGREGADPGAVAFDAVNAGRARGMDVVLLDTAGRLHTKTDLMEELKKVHRVVKKVIPEAPHEIWLVLDGNSGQNAVQQAREFKKALDLTGVVITKLDGTSKGGAVLSVASDLKLPVKYIGVGESVEALVPFEPNRFVDAILPTHES